MKDKYATWLPLLFFVLSVISGYFLPDYIIAKTGFTIAVILSFFAKDIVTICLGTASTLVLATPFVYKHQDLKAMEIHEDLYSVLQVAIITLLFLYLKRQSRKTTKEKHYHDSMFKYATEGILLTNDKGKILMANPVSLRLFGYTSEEITGKPVEMLIPARYSMQHTTQRGDFYKNPQNRIMGVGRDLVAQRKDGTTLPVEISLSTFKDQEKLFVIAFIVDISRRKEIENSIIRQSVELEEKVAERTLILKEALSKLEQSQNELRESLEKEKELNDVKSRFVSIASHEFRTPLSTVLSSAELIGKYKKEEEQEKRDRHVSKIKNSVDHLNDILEDFLSLGKLNEGRVACEKSLFNLKDLFQSVIEEMETIRKPGQEIIQNYEGDTVIFSNGKLVKNILINLLSNAIKYSDENKNIWIKGESADSKVHIAIRDEGIGICEEDQHHLFINTFFRGRNAINIPGTGLGLHIVKRYTDLLNGRVDIKSSLDKGTTVTVTLNLNEKTHENA